MKSFFRNKELKSESTVINIGVDINLKVNNLQSHYLRGDIIFKSQDVKLTDINDYCNNSNDFRIKIKYLL